MVALVRAGINVDRYVAYEVDKRAISISRYHFPMIEHMGDVVGADFSQYKGFDIVMGGFPCQDLSIAKRNRTGLYGKRSGLFWELVRAINEVEPKYFLVENNASMPKESKDVISKTLGVEPVLINSGLLSAQNRKRLYWTNIAVPPPIDKSIYLKDILESGLPLEDKAFCKNFTYKEVTHE